MIKNPFGTMISMRKLSMTAAALFAAAALQSCAKTVEEPEEPVEKVETPMWRIMMKKPPGQEHMKYEDSWFVYNVNIIFKGASVFQSSIGGQCPIEKAVFKVEDKENKRLVREETFGQVPCRNCHPNAQ